MRNTAENVPTLSTTANHTSVGNALRMLPNGGSCLGGLVLNVRQPNVIGGVGSARMKDPLSEAGWPIITEPFATLYEAGLLIVFFRYSAFCRKSENAEKCVFFLDRVDRK